MWAADTGHRPVCLFVGRRAANGISAAEALACWDEPTGSVRGKRLAIGDAAVGSGGSPDSGDSPCGGSDQETGDPSGQAWRPPAGAQDAPLVSAMRSPGRL